MKCPSCQAENAPGLSSCLTCGAILEHPESAQTIAMPGAGGAAAARAPYPFASTEEATIAMASGAGALSLHLEPGTVFGPRYTIEALLGEGGMGAVYRARDNELGRTVALKLVRGELARSPGAMERFKRELLLASRITHTNILRIHDLGDVSGLKFISMAYVDGQDLCALMEKTGRLPLDRVLKIARQLSAALDAAHNENVVHRDLKPQNILLDETDHVYVSDFGLAKSLESEVTAMTHTGQILGTPRHMAPEQVEGKPADHRSDIYSLGLILYEMATGETPFANGSTFQIMYQRVTQIPRSPKLVNPDIPEYLVRIIMRCLERDPGRRYQLAREILEDLESGQPPAGASRIRAPKIRRASRPLIAAVAVIAALIAGIVPLVRNRSGPASPPQTSTVTPATDRYIALLPLRIAGNDRFLKYAAEGMIEALSAKLSGLRSVYVASSSAVEEAKTRGPIDKVAKSLGVGLVLDGTIRATGDRISGTLTLHDAVNRRQIWSHDFSGLRQDLLAVQDGIYTQLVAALGVQPGDEEPLRSTAHPTENFDAYELYLKARTAARGTKTLKSMNEAMNLYSQAIKKDPEFALAYAGVADASLSLYGLTRDTFWSERALGAAHQAARLNDNLPEVHAALGSVYRATGRTAEAIAELKRALELEPNSDEDLRRLGSTYLSAGRQDEAIQAFQKAIEVNPYYWANHNQLGAAYYQIGQNEKAAEAFRRVTELEPDRASGYINLGAVFYRQGKWTECVPLFQKAIELQPSSRGYSNLGVAYFYQGRYQEAAQAFEKAVEMNPNEQLAVGNLADAYRWLGQRAKASATYDRAINLAFKGLQVNPRDADLLGSLATYYAKQGNTSRAEQYIQRARAINAKSNGLLYKQALVDALGGRRADALESLREALQMGYPPEEAKNDPELAGLRSDAKFAQILSKFSRKGF